MALSSGREEFAVAFVGKDEVSAMITELQAKLKGLEGQAKAAGSAGASAAGAGGIKGLGESLKSATSGATSLGGGLAGLRMGMLGIPTAIGGMVAGVVAFASAIKDAFVRDPIKEFHDEFKRDFAAMEAAADKLIARLRDAKGLLKDATTKELSAKGELENVIATADALLGPLKKQNEFLEQQTKAWLEQKDVLAGMDVVFRGMVSPLNQQRELQNEIKRISDERFAAQEKLNELLSAQNASLATTVALEAAAARERSKQSILTKIQADTAAPMGVLAALGAKYGGKKPTGGGGSLSDTEKLRRALLSGDQAAIDKAFGGQGEGIRLGGLSDMGRGGFGAEDIDKANELAKIELEALKRADSTWEDLSNLWAKEEERAARRKPIDDVVALTQALGGLADIAPEISSAFSEIGSVFSATAEAGGTMGDAVVASIGPMGKLAAGVIKGEREKALVRGLAETAESIASFASGNIPGGVGHAAAAAAFFGVAGKGGGGQRGIAGGGREGAAAGTTAGAANDNEPRTVVYNISAGVMDGQSVQRAIVRAEGSARGTGWESRRGW